MSNAKAIANTAKLKSPDQAKADLEARGISIAEFARGHGLRYGTVYQVLTGKKKGRRGEAHRAAVLLGLKKGIA
ncbi:DNA-binding protein [Lysobacter sp. CA199]|uniref:DNA-binding protein n=1 Tax=Lysobacter sp. CA199 TaxID=3455608 RepID=UPI003F8D3AA5